VAASRLATASFDVGSGLPAGYRLQGSLVNAVEHASRERVSRRSERPTILFVGTWGGRKRGAFLAECFVRHVLPRHPTAELVMVTDRYDPSAGVRMVTFPSDEELSDLYRSAWLFCMPSTYEGFGMPYLEAMTHGLPVVATANPGANYLLSGGAGHLVEDRHLGPSLARLLADSQERRRLADAGRKRSQAFTWERVLDEHESAYRSAITKFTRRHIA
jgi:glycosyltransferase involved in cell wall biosynthesis